MCVIKAVPIVTGRVQMCPGMTESIEPYLQHHMHGVEPVRRRRKSSVKITIHHNTIHATFADASIMNSVVRVHFSSTKLMRKSAGAARRPVDESSFFQATTWWSFMSLIEHSPPTCSSGQLILLIPYVLGAEQLGQSLNHCAVQLLYCLLYDSMTP